MKLYFVRHGESEANLLNEFSNRGVKHGLTVKGREQALQLAQNLKSVSITAIFASPILRAQQTAEILARASGGTYQIADALREYDVGILEGKSDPASWQIYWEVSNAWLAHRDWDRRIAGGESFRDIERRFIPFITELRQTYQSPTDAIVLVGHGGTYRCMLPLILQNIDVQFAAAHGLDHTEAVVAELRGRQLVCVAWGETMFEISVA
jgi:broad specificity phosphatase PhoE